MAFDTRVETVVFIRANGRGDGEKPRYRQARYVLVNYDNSPDAYLEARSMATVGDPTGAIINPDTGRSLVDRVEFYDFNPFNELHDFSDGGL